MASEHTVDPPGAHDFAAARARYELGQAFFGQAHVLYEVSGDFAGAVTHHHAAIQLNPHDARGHHAYLATVLASRGSLDGAAEEVHACIRLGGVRALRDSLGQQARALAQTHFDEGEAFFEQEMWGEALVAYHAAVEMVPEMSEAWWGIAKTFSAQSGRPCAAMYLPLMRCIELDPGNALAHNSLGHVLRDPFAGVEDTPRAEVHLREALRLEPHFAFPRDRTILDARSEFALVLAARGDVDGGIHQMCESIRLVDDKFVFLLARIFLLLVLILRKLYLLIPLLATSAAFIAYKFVVFWYYNIWFILTALIIDAILTFFKSPDMIIG